VDAELGRLLAARTTLPDQTYNTEAFFDLDMLVYNL
jgi:hypothetical protein